MVYHTSKIPRPPETEQTDSIDGEEDKTLDRFFGFRRLLVISPCRYQFGRL
jgi:hypothetical protein